MDYEEKEELIAEIFNKNKIKIPRLRNGRIMYFQEPVETERIYRDIQDAKFLAVRKAREGGFALNPDILIWDDSVEKWMNKHTNQEHYAVYWDTIHGKQRKVCKYQYKKYKHDILLQYLMFNKYIGRKDVICVFAKSGSWAWYEQFDKYKNESWFIDACDWYKDPAYCYIYVKIDPLTDDEIKRFKEYYLSDE